MKTRLSQSAQILKALENGERISPLGALERWGCFRLATRIFYLKQAGYNIMTKIEKGANGKHWAVYYMPDRTRGNK